MTRNAKASKRKFYSSIRDKKEKSFRGQLEIGKIGLFSRGVFVGF